MASHTQTDLTDIAERLLTVAKTLRRLPSGHTCCPEEVEGLCKEVRAIAAKIRGKQCHETKRVEVRYPLC